MTETLPNWDLTDFYTSPEDAALKTDLDHLQQMTNTFCQEYRGRFEEGLEWRPQDLAQTIQSYEAIQEKAGKVMSYGYLLYSTNNSDPKVLQFFQKLQEEINKISTDLIFFTLDLNKLEESSLDKAYQDPSLLKYRPWLEGVRLFRLHQLSPEIEKILHEKSLTSSLAWVRLYDETLGRMTFDWEGQKVPLADILSKTSDKDRLTRQKASQALSKGLTEFLPLFTLVTNTLAKDKELEDRWRSYPSPVSFRNLANQTDDETVDALIKAVKKNYKNLSHHYYQMKAKWLGLDQLEYWDRNAPLPEADDSKIPWEDAKSIVLEAYHEFSPEMAEVGKEFFVKPWIDAAPKTGKESGAYSHPTVPSVHPYILMNYHGKMRDVMTLAHELGHGVHQCLAGPQGTLLSETPLTIAETASVFGEMLTFKALLRRTKDQGKRKALIASKVEDMLNTVVRQIAFFDFEYEVHTRRAHGELTAEELGAIFYETQTKALGPGVKIDPLVHCYWAYISHFIHSAFYVYAYAFGDCLVNSLYSVYEKGHEGFEKKYLDMLRAGGTKRYDELLRPFGLDAKDPTFWEKGLTVISDLINELERY